MKYLQVSENNRNFAPWKQKTTWIREVETLILLAIPDSLDFPDFHNYI